MSRPGPTRTCCKCFWFGPGTASATSSPRTADWCSGVEARGGYLPQRHTQDNRGCKVRLMMKVPHIIELTGVASGLHHYFFVKNTCFEGLNQ